MNRPKWKWMVVGVIALLLLALGGALGVRLYLVHRNQQWHSQAEQAYQQGNWETAKYYYERYIPQDKENTDLLLHYADACRHIVDDRVSALQSASIAYLQILAYHPEKNEIRFELLNLYRKMNAWSNIEYYSKNWLTSDPDNEDLMFWHALALDRLGRRDEAIDEYQKLVDRNTDHSETYGNLARLLYDRGRENKANEVLQAAVEKRPDDAQVRLDYARLVSRGRNWDRVDELLAEATRIAPDNPQVLMALAQAASLKEDYETAIEDLYKAIDAAPEEGNGYLLLASAYIAKNEFAKAVDVLKNVGLLVQVDNPMILITLVDLQLSQKQFDDAHETIALYTSAYPGQLPVEEYFAAKELLIKGDAPGAVRKLALVVELRPNFSQAQYALAIAYLQSGDMELARNALEAYVSNNSSDVQAQQLLERNFGKPTPSDVTLRRAKEALNDPTVDSESLLSMATALFNATRAEGTLDANADVIRQLIANSLKKEPTHSSGYRVLVDLALAQGDLATAQQSLSDALAAGVEEVALAKSRAGIALAANDSEEALRIAQTALGPGSLSPGDVIDWSSFFMSRGQYRLGIAILDVAVDRMETEDGRFQVELQRVILAAQEREIPQALQWLKPLETEIDTNSPIRRRLNAARLKIVEAMLAAPDTDYESDIRGLVGQVRAEESDNPTLQTIDGFMLLKQKPPRITEAEALFEKAATDSPRDVNAQWGLARAARLKEDYPKALTYAQRAVDLAPDAPVLQLQLGEILSRMDRPIEAETAFRRVLAAYPNDAEALRMLAISLIERNQVRPARDVLARLERALKNDPNKDKILRALNGRLLMVEGSTEEADRLLRQQYEANPEDLEALRNWAASLFNKGRTGEATEMLREYAESHPSNAEAWVSLAKFYLAGQGDDHLAEASTALTRALIANPDYIPALRDMLEVRLRQRDSVEALSLCERYLEKNPDTPDMLNMRATLLFDFQGKLGDALETINQAIDLDDRPEYRATRGVILVAQGNYRAALKDLQTAALEMPSTSARIDLAFAQAYLASGNTQAAREYYDSAVKKVNEGDRFDPGRLKQFESALKQRETAA